MEVTKVIDREAGMIPTANISELNTLMYACARLAMDKLNIKVNSKNGKQMKEGEIIYPVEEKDYIKCMYIRCGVSWPKA